MRKKTARKTTSVVRIKLEINKLLALPESKMSEDAKQALCGVLEDILMESGNYDGFNHVDWCERGFKQWMEAGEPDFPEKQEYIGREYSRKYY